MYVKRNIEARSCNHCCSGKTIIFTYSNCVSIVIGTQHAMRMRRIIIRGLPGSAILFPHYLIKVTIFKKKNV